MMIQNTLSKNPFKSLLGFMFVLLICSCSKDLQDIQEIDGSDEKITALKSNTSLNSPTIKGDLVVFQDLRHFEDFYLGLNQIYEEDYENFDQYVPTDHSFISVHTKLSNDKFVNPDDRYQPFLTDPIMMAIVNENFEFQIENTLVTYMNNTEILISDVNDTKTQQQIRSMAKGQKLDLNAIPKKAYWGKDTELDSFRAFCGCSIEVERISCTEVEVKGSCKNDDFSESGGKLFVAITDSPNHPFDSPNPPTVVSTSVNGAFSIILPMSQSNTVWVHAKIKPRCLFGKTQFSSLQFVPGNGSCDNSESSTGYLWAQDNGVQGYTHRTCFFQNAFVKFSEAKMWSYQFDGDEWVPVSKRLTVKLEEKRMNRYCVTKFDRDKRKSCDCQSLQVRVGLNFFGGTNDTHCPGDVKGWFRKSLTWEGQSWDINAQGVVDFDCCQ